MYKRSRIVHPAPEAVIGIVMCAIVSCGGPYRDGNNGGDRWTEARSAVDRTIVSLLEAEHYDEALALIDSTAAAGGEYPRLLGQKAHALGGLGRTDEAVPLFERTLLADYASCENHLDFAVLLMKMGKIGRAITEFNEAKKFCEPANMAMIHRNLAVAELELGRKEQALADVRGGLEYGPNDPYLLGLHAVLIMEAQPFEAESLFVRARETGGLETAFLYQYGLLLLNSGRAKEAAAVLDTVASLMPDDYDVQRNRAEALLRSGRPQEAETVLRGLREMRDDPGVTESLAGALFKQDRFGEALDLYRELPESPEVRDRVAMCLHGLGRLDEAARIQRGLLADRPDWAAAHINMAVILAARGELDEALKHLTRALEIDPGNATARFNLERLREAKEKAER